MKSENKLQMMKINKWKYDKSDIRLQVTKGVINIKAWSDFQ